MESHTVYMKSLIFNLETKFFRIGGLGWLDLVKIGEKNIENL